MKKTNFGISLQKCYHSCGVPPGGYMPIFGPIGPPRTERAVAKVYLVSYTNKTKDSEAIF